MLLVLPWILALRAAGLRRRTPGPGGSAPSYGDCQWHGLAAPALAAASETHRQAAARRRAALKTIMIESPDDQIPSQLDSEIRGISMTHRDWRQDRFK